MHHPRGGGVVEHARARGEVAVDEEFLLVLQEGAGRGVDNGLGQAGGAARVEDVERVRGRKLGEHEGIFLG